MSGRKNKDKQRKLIPINNAVGSGEGNIYRGLPNKTKQNLNTFILFVSRQN